MEPETETREMVSRRTNRWNYRTLLFLTIGIVEVFNPILGSAQTLPRVESNAKPLRATPNCIRTAVSGITTRLVSLDPKTGREKVVPSSGFQITFGGTLPDPYVGSLHPGLVFYQGDAANELIALERRGDPTQVCVIAYPDVQTLTHQPGLCDPTRDPRGRTLRVYDYKLQTAYIGPNSEHGCGGA